MFSLKAKQLFFTAARIRCAHRATSLLMFQFYVILGCLLCIILVYPRLLFQNKISAHAFFPPSFFRIISIRQFILLVDYYGQTHLQLLHTQNDCCKNLCLQSCLTVVCSTCMCM